MNFKSALIAAAAVVGVAGAAQAADLAKKAPAAANYVKVCDAYGAGFFYIPGSETCLKIGGYVRADVYAFSTSREWAGIGTSGATGRDKHAINTLAKAQLQFDARTATEMGLLRSYVEVNIANYSASNGNVLPELAKGFVQFGGLTAGRAQSFFDFWTGDTYGAWFEPAHSDANINLLGYTFAFGNGISASVSIEDPSTGNTGRRMSLVNTALAVNNTSYAGVKYPDFVANVAISQAWGSAQIMGALHQNYAAIAPTDKWGFAVGAGVKVNLPMLGASDTLTLQAVYAKGASSYVSPNWNTDGQFSGTVSVNAFDFWVPTTAIEQSSAWSVAGALTHGWTKTLTSSFEASYAAHDAATTSVMDFNMIDLQANLVWAPVDGLAIGPEIEYRRIDYSGATNALGVKDVNAIVGMLRVQRNF